MINWSRVTELRNDVGSDDFDDLVEIFLEEVEEEIAKLQDTADRTGLEARLHLLKGSALNLGFRDFSEQCQQGETAAAAGQADSVDIGEIVACYAASKNLFLSGLSSLDAA